MRSAATYLVECGEHTWAETGKDMNEGVINAFKKIRDECHAKKLAISLGLTFTVRRDNEPRSRAIKGCTLNMLRLIGELGDDVVRKVTGTLGDHNGTKSRH